MTTELACVGVDGAKSGWIAVWRANHLLEARVYPSPWSLVADHKQARIIAVDVPMGLSDQGARLADAEARRFVGGRRACSVFSSPVRGILDATSQPEASRRHRAIDGRGFGAQSFAILPKIREWDELLQCDSQARLTVREIHPEVSFAALNGGFGRGLAYRKKSPEGITLRKALLSPNFGSPAMERLLGAVDRRLAAIDDVLDALAALWTAERIITGSAHSLPAEPEMDSAGLVSAIWY